MNRAERDARIAALKERIGGDALFRPSSFSRLLKCTGFVQLAAQVPRSRKSSSYALEGTAAHLMASEALENIRQPEEWIDRMIRPPGEAEGWMVDSNMVFNVRAYLDEVGKRWTPTTQMFVERKLTLAHLDPTDAMLAENRGTGDCILVDTARRHVTLIDLKFGRGVMVDGDAPQLRDYMTMVLLEFASLVAPHGWASCETIVVQPRASDPDQRLKVVPHDPFDLTMNFLGEAVAAMNAALEDNPPLTAGDHCRWCEGLPICPAVRDKAVNLARDSFAQTPIFSATAPLRPMPPVFVGTPDQPAPMEVRHGQVVLPPVRSLDPGDLATVLSRADLFEEWITAIRHYATQLIEGGVNVPGWELYARTGNRSWIDPDKVPVALRQAGLKTAEMYTDPELKSPAQMEKLLPKDKRGVIADLVHRPMGKPTLTRVSEKRTALPPVMGQAPPPKIA